ncbi:hypothetical protein Tco_0789161 [Tanacetum coccineum]
MKSSFKNSKILGCYTKDKESDKALVVAAVVSEKSAIDEKDIRKVTNKVSKVSDESDKATVVALVLKEKPADVIEKSIVVKESDKASVVKESDKAPVVKDSDKASVVKESDKATIIVPVLKEKPADVIENSTVVNEKEKAVVDVTSKVAKDKEKLAVYFTSKVGKSKVVVHKDKALDVVSKDKPKGNPPSVVGKGNASSVVGKAKDKLSVVKGKVLTELPKKKHKADIPKDKPKPKDKHKVYTKVLVLRSKPEVKAKASISEDVKRKRMLSKEDPKKIKIKAEVKRKRKGGSDSDSDSVDEEKLRRVLKKLKKIKTGYSDEEYSDEESGMKSNKKGKKKEKQLTPEEAAQYLREFQLFMQDVRPIEHEFVRSWVDKFYPKSLKEIRVGRVAGLKGQICLDVARRLREESVIFEIDWCGYIHSCLEDSELPKKPIVHYLGPFTFLIGAYGCILGVKWEAGK